jgi:predicted nucleotide-binding protein
MDRPPVGRSQALNCSASSHKHKMTNEQRDISRDPRAVFVIHGRHEKSREAMFAFLIALGLKPLEWSYLVRLTGKGSPYVGEVLDAGFKRATAAVILLTPDDEARLRPQFQSVNEPVYETILTGQARSNVICEAGMALGFAPNQTILVELGTLRPISDLSGRHTIRINDSESRRRELAERLETAGCTISYSASDWKMAGDFDSAIQDLVQPPNADSIIPIDLLPGHTMECSEERGQLGNTTYDFRKYRA